MVSRWEFTRFQQKVTYLQTVCVIESRGMNTSVHTVCTYFHVEHWCKGKTD